jgi:hypothetical protein
LNIFEKETKDERKKTETALKGYRADSVTEESADN